MASFKPRSKSFGFLSLVHIRVKGLFELAQESGRFREDSMQRMGPYSPGNLAYRCWSRSQTVKGSNKTKGRIYWMSCVKLNPDSVYSIMLQYLVSRNSFRRFIVVFHWDRTYSPPCINWTEFFVLSCWNMISLIFELRLILEISETTVLAKMIMHICSANCTAF